MRESAAAGGVAESARAEGVAESAGAEGVAESAGAEGVAESAPLRLTLGEQSRIRIVLDARLPADAHSRLVYASNVGTVEAPTIDARGRIVVDYVPPPEMHPQVALIVVLDPLSGAAYHQRVDLVGRARLKIESEPHVRIRVSVGGRSYGPVRTDERGRAEVPIQVHPGETRALTLARDAYGNERRSTMHLNAPAFRRHVMLCLLERHVAYVRVVDTGGSEARELASEIKTQRIELGATERVAPGLFRIRFRPQSGRDPSLPVRLTVRLNTPPAEESHCAATLAAPEPTAIVTAPPKPDRFEVAMRAGLVANFGQVVAPWVSMRALFKANLLGHRLWWGPELGYYESRRNLETTEVFPASIVLRGVPMLAVARYARRLGPLELRGGFSAGALALRLSSRLADSSQLRQARVAFWLAGSASAGASVGPGLLDVEVGWAWSEVDTPELMGNAAGLRATVGYGLRF